jgi:hypothetical protein
MHERGRRISKCGTNAILVGWRGEERAFREKINKYM